jgi:hypothetical protein
MKKQEIKDQLTKQHQAFADYLSGLSEAEFLLSNDKKWTAGQQLDHIVRGVSPVKLALTLPKFVPGLIFGKANRSQQTYDELVETYQGKLAAGSKASGRFLPDNIRFSQREGLNKKLLVAIEGLNNKIETHSEDDLDRCLLPHPILGKLAIREMLYFTIYHVQHHHKQVVKNLEIR